MTSGSDTAALARLSLRSRITTIVCVVFLVLTTLLLFEMHNREREMQTRLENALLTSLELNLESLQDVEFQRVEAYARRFQENRELAQGLRDRDADLIDLELVELQAELDPTAAQFVSFDGEFLGGSDDPLVEAPILTAEHLDLLRAQGRVTTGLTFGADGSLVHVAAAPLFVQARPVAAAIVISPFQRTTDKLAKGFGSQVLTLSQDGDVLQSSGTAMVEEQQTKISAQSTRWGISLLEDDGRFLQIASLPVPSAFLDAPLHVVGVQDASDALYETRIGNAISALALASGLTLFLAFINWSLRHSFFPLNAVIRSLDALSEGKTDQAVNVPKTDDEIGRLAGTFEVFRKSMEARSELERVNRELDVATRIQQQCLPTTFPELAEMSFAADMVPMREVGGDFYDVFDLPSGKIGCVIADVSDKGMGAALFMAISRTVMRAIAASARGPADCVTMVNNYLCVDNDAMLFVTLFYVEIDPNTGAMVFCNAGHNPPVIVGPETEPRYLKFDQGQPALAVWEDFDYEEETGVLNPGETLFCYTDGVTEAMSAELEEYGEARLLEAMRPLMGATPSDQLNAVMKSVSTFTEGAETSDDITCLSIEFKGPSSQSEGGAAGQAD
ncbi:PP2C family protein-serine/threonine phosphatase [uncultured Ruegeria sp.]|uniref:PP2C family protein-serine/threonine phosphatase n=1 Tax=uncultured Ruegeria sp. TaxID=259304 RepID=UPI002613C204|nr:PP2C family protein-serine/threonine phosphatase [uncultured Ruegeria sp.]